MIQLDALEQSAEIIKTARFALTGNDTLWTLLFHAERYVQQEFRSAFNEYFGFDDREELVNV